MARSKSIWERVQSSPMTRNMATLAGITFIKSIFDFEEPMQLLGLRLISLVAHLCLYGTLAYFYYKSKNAETSDKVIYVRPSQLESQMSSPLRDQSDPDEKKPMTQFEYDCVKLQDVAQQMSMTTLIVVGMHFYFGYAIPLLMTILVQARMVYATPFFKIFIQGKDEKVYRELRRPWAPPKVGGIQKMMQDSLSRRYTDLQKELEADGQDPSAPTSGAPAAKGSRAKRRSAAARS
ncbi:SRP-independent targeting protein 3-like [Hondaea fermentalgiana]|uniref:SRP-independent targeting protein 3-like n=1 Tax=Hondaea fermentalgiana TaxID=2315210 RepID=A0A2R5GIQ3_9STRA|nr:SRP-independent targeting protein 3-like [Hondaea fermentalgiana]|eukprot:GBG29608.1 SRP-independent targeting protein 3-like [Hondaea fermentalgiana]